MLEGLDVLAGLNVFTLGVVEIRDSECPSSQSCATTESFLLCSVFGWILKPRSLIFVCVCVWLQQLMAFLSQRRPACEMRSDNRRRSWMCTVKSLLSGFSWMSVRASPSPGLYPGNWFIQRGGGTKHIQVEVSFSPRTLKVPFFRSSLPSGSTLRSAGQHLLLLGDRRLSQQLSASGEDQLLLAFHFSATPRALRLQESATNFPLFFLCLNKLFRRSSHQLIILAG